MKVVTALDGKALYFSRATIPHDRDQGGFAGYRKHLGIYAYRKAALEKFAELPPGWLESVEKLEQLRLLEAGIDIYVAGAPADTIGVDTEEDLERAEALLRSGTKDRSDRRIAVAGSQTHMPVAKHLTVTKLIATSATGYKTRATG